METSILTDIILPISLFIMMLGMGLSLAIADFVRVVRYPKAVGIGLFNQIIILPIVGFLIARALTLSPAFAVGLIVLAACPGGVTSNLITHVSKGDIALSVTLTAISSIITVFTIPIILSFSMDLFLGESQSINLPILRTIGQILVITILPISIGMFIRRKKAAFAERMEKPMRIASAGLLGLIILGIGIDNREILLDSFQQLGVATLVLCTLMMLIGFLSAKSFHLNLPQRISISIESGVQNATLGIVIASAILSRTDIALVPAFYGLIMFFPAAFFMLRFGRREGYL